MPSLPDYLSDNPLLDDIAKELSCPVDELRGPLLNQRIYAGPGDRIPREVVYAALEAEIAAGRWFPVRRLESWAPHVAPPLSR
jgi:hypothetical protein